MAKEKTFGSKSYGTTWKVARMNLAIRGINALPGQPFYRTQIAAYLWFEVKKNAPEASNDSRLFDGETELSLVT